MESVLWDAQGLVPAIAQDASTGRVLMMAWMNRDALKETLESGNVVYWSRSRARLWRKGETSGNTQRVVDLRIDCDGDALLIGVEQRGGVACHTGRESCFYRACEDGAWREQDPVRVDPVELYGQRT